MKDEYEFYKAKETDTLYQVDHVGVNGEVLFSFDKKTIFNAWTDYPDKLTKEQKAIFDKDMPFWADFFADRC